MAPTNAQVAYYLGREYEDLGEHSAASKERLQTLEAELAVALPFLPPGGRLLEIGAGTGYFTLNLMQEGVVESAVTFMSSDP